MSGAARVVISSCATPGPARRRSATEPTRRSRGDAAAGAGRRAASPPRGGGWTPYRAPPRACEWREGAGRSFSGDVGVGLTQVVLHGALRDAERAAHAD